MPDERLAKQLNIRYSCSKNLYERFLHLSDTSSSKKVICHKDSWESGTFLSTNMFRKLERDWKMVYLARTEGSTEASIEWKFNFGDLHVKKILLRLDTKTYENGSVKLLFLNENGAETQCLDDIKNQSQFSIKAILWGGKGDCAWQHTQLFRQRSSEYDDYPFELNIIFY